MILTALEVANFRKFRDPLRIEGFASGLNIVVEPNESGKSTLLAALRAALFVRYSSRGDLAQSFRPIGDDVAPRISLEFDLRGDHWLLEKQFLKAAFVRLSGAGRRIESDAAEDALQELLGFERGNNRGSDAEARGPLGMLWVEQAAALEVASPNRIVRDTVRGVLEAEVGAVTGGRKFEVIREKVEAAYSALRTPRSGLPRGELAAAEARLAGASESLRKAEAVLKEYQQSLTDLETAKARLRIVERDLADPEPAEQRRKLEDDLKAGETAIWRSKTAEAEHGQAEEIARTAAARIERLDTAEARVEAMRAGLDAKQATRDAAQAAADAASKKEKQLRKAGETCHGALVQCETALTEARNRSRIFARLAGERRAIAMRDALVELEKRERLLVGAADAAIPQADLDAVAALEGAAIEARARFEAGRVRVDFNFGDDVALRIDGEASDAASIDVLSVTRIDIGEAGSLIIHPPAGSGRSMEADRAVAEEQLANALRALDCESHLGAVAKNERANAAGRELIALRAQIAAACPGDPVIGLAPGAEALHSFVAGLAETPNEGVPPTDDIAALEASVAEARLADAEANARREEARQSLSAAESRLAAATADFDAATRECEVAAEDLRTVLADGHREALKEVLAETQRNRATKLEALEAARAAAAAFDMDAAQRRLVNINRAAGRVVEERVELAGRIASIEAIVAREAPAGPAGQAETAREEEEAALAACERLRREADTLEKLRAVLADAAAQASRTFLAPVTRRAARYIGQLLPGCELAFDEQLGLASVTRAGIDESCSGLSKGTQEQLAILTRLAFADLLLEDGAPISLILDDPLVYSDDTRLEVMTNILQDASKRMQVILLTCRSKAFRHVDANWIAIP